MRISPGSDEDCNQEAEGHAKGGDYEKVAAAAQQANAAIDQEEREEGEDQSDSGEGDVKGVVKGVVGVAAVGDVEDGVGGPLEERQSSTRARIDGGDLQ